MTRFRRDPGETLSRTRSALRQRLIVAADVLLTDRADVTSLSTSALVHQLALHAKRSEGSAATWLLHTALVGVMPEPEQVSDLRRRLDLASDGAAIVAVLESTVDLASRDGGSMRTMRLESDRILVDVNFCASHEHNTGLQRVVRKTMPHWAEAQLPVEFVAWTRDGDGYRALSETERERVLEWDARHLRESLSRSTPEHRDQRDDDEHELIVPWGTTVFLPEVPFQHLCRKISSIALDSGNDVRLIGYDAIPLVSAESQPPQESERFAHYLTVVKHSSLVIGISESAAMEFAGFTRTLAAQGVDGPAVCTVSLAREASPTHLSQPHEGPNPVVLCVGSHEPRKNQEAVLYAAERLHAEGLEFEMVFVGGGSRSAVHHFDSRVRRIRKRGFAVRSVRRASDLELGELYARARFSVFVSLHEGYGLPVVESLSHGTPVLTSNYGSIAEIARGGGCVQVDPRDDEQILDGMRQLLVDDALVRSLSEEAVSVPARPWSQYAQELWNAVTETASAAHS